MAKRKQTDNLETMAVEEFIKLNKGDVFNFLNNRTLEYIKTHLTRTMAEDVQSVQNKIRTLCNPNDIMEIRETQGRITAFQEILNVFDILNDKVSKI